MRILIALLFFNMMTIRVLSQEISSPIITQLLEDMASNNIELPDDSEWIDELAEISENPINLNQPDRQKLLAIPFFDAIQADAIIRRSHHGGFETIEELITIDGISKEMIEIIKPFVCIGLKLEIKQSMRLRGRTLAMAQTTTPKQVGYTAKNDSASPAFIGKPIKYLLKHELRLGRDIKAGVVFENDAGEPAFSRYMSTTDFVSGYVQWQPKRTIFKNIIIGHYSARFGQGAGLWTGFAADFSSIGTSVMRHGNGITPNWSAAESGYLRGIAANAAIGRTNIWVFASNTDGDASTSSVDTSDYVTTIKETGYHRTIGELSSRNNLTQKLYGGYIQHTFDGIRVGIGVNHWQSNRDFTTGDDLYRKFRFSGNSLTTASADYALFHNNISLYGEIAMQKGNIAITQGIDIDVIGNTKLTLAYRNFSRKYTSVYQNTFARSSQPAGEEGIYAALSFNQIKRLSIICNANIYKNRWLKYQVFAPSKGYIWRVKAIYNAGRNTLTAQIKGNIDDKHPLEAIDGGQSRPISTHSRYSYKVAWNATFDIVKFQTIAELIDFSDGSQHNSSGFWISQDAKISILTNTKLDLRFAHFDTDDYYSRIYAYQPDIMYSFSIPAYSGNGILLVGNISTKLGRHLKIWARTLYVRYYKTQTISSGNTQIKSPHSTEFKLQMLWTF